LKSFEKFFATSGGMNFRQFDKKRGLVLVIVDEILTRAASYVAWRPYTGWRCRRRRSCRYATSPVYGRL